MRRQTVLTIALVVASVFVLSGCESHGRGPASISRDGSELLLAVCEPLHLGSIYGTVDSAKSGRDWTSFLDVEGDAELAAGAEMSGDSLPTGVRGTWSAVNFGSIEAINLSFVGANTNDGFLATFYNGGDLEVPESKWLQANGLITDTPCAS